MSPHVLMNHLFVYILCCAAMQLGPDNLVWTVIVGVAMATNVAFMIRNHIRGPQLTAEQRLEMSRQRTAELEKDLGYKPLNLRELDEILLDDQKNRKEQP